MRNREIAERLFLSERTIERHLSRIFPKLAISSRAGLAASVARARATAPAPTNPGTRASLLAQPTLARPHRTGETGV